LRVVTVLVEPRDDANVGAVARALKNAGFSDLRLVRRRKPSARARRMAVHAEDVLEGARRFATLSEAVADASLVIGFTARPRRFGPRLEVFDARVASELRALSRRGTVALVFGPEASGLADADVRLCSRLVRLPAAPARPIYNLAQSVVLATHAIAFAPRGARSAPATPRVDLSALIESFARALHALGYPPPERPHDRTARILARIEAQLTRAGLDADDVAMWRGVLARIAPAREVVARDRGTRAP